jgi:hypothetical protein
MDEQKMKYYIFFKLLDKGYEPTEEMINDIVEIINGWVSSEWD